MEPKTGTFILLNAKHQTLGDQMVLSTNLLEAKLKANFF